MGNVIAFFPNKLGSVQKDGLNQEHEHLSILSSDQPPKPSWENEGRLTAVSLYALWAQVHA